MNVKSVLTAATLSLAVSVGGALADKPAELNDLEIAHVAYTADLIDIRYAHLALAISKNEDVRQFANSMINDQSRCCARSLAQRRCTFTGIAVMVRSPRRALGRV